MGFKLCPPPSLGVHLLLLMGFAGYIDGAEVVFQPPTLHEEILRVWVFHNLYWVVESNTPLIRRRRAALLHEHPASARFTLMRSG